VAGDDAWRRAAALHTRLSWGARPRAHAVPRCSADDGETNWGGADGGDATAVTLHAAARLGAAANSGERLRAVRSTGSSTRIARMLLTSLRGSWAISRRRSDGSDKNPKAAALGFRRDAAQEAAGGSDGSGRRP
jgi:hypothetical protein